MKTAATTIAPQRELQTASPTVASTAEAPPEPHHELRIAPRHLATWLALSAVGWTAAFAGWWALTLAL